MSDTQDNNKVTHLAITAANAEGQGWSSSFQPMPVEITKAILKVMKAVRGIRKSGRNDFHNYAYATNNDVLLPLQKAFVDARLVVTQHCMGTTMDDSGNVIVRFRFMLHHESGTSYIYPGEWLGVASDRDRNGRLGDKYYNKAATSAEKYFMIKLFRIPVTGEMTLSDKVTHAGLVPTTMGPRLVHQQPQAPQQGHAPANQASSATQEERNLANTIRDEIDASDKPMQVLIDRHDDIGRIRAVSETAAVALEKRAAQRQAMVSPAGMLSGN